MKSQETKVYSALFAERRAICCPKCVVPMTLTTVAGIPVEKCPTCEGTFFDKGEVERLIRRSLRSERFKMFRWFGWS